jgi:hypothetical protein
VGAYVRVSITFVIKFVKVFSYSNKATALGFDVILLASIEVLAELDVRVILKTYHH